MPLEYRNAMIFSNTSWISIPQVLRLIRNMVRNWVILSSGLDKDKLMSFVETLTRSLQKPLVITCGWTRLDLLWAGPVGSSQDLWWRWWAPGAEKEGHTPCYAFQPGVSACLLVAAGWHGPSAEDHEGFTGPSLCHLSALSALPLAPLGWFVLFRELVHPPPSL